MTNGEFLADLTKRITMIDMDGLDQSEKPAITRLREIAEQTLKDEKYPKVRP